jgi:hypothetical protein
MTNHRRQAESSIIQIDEIDTPLMRRGIVQPERLRLDVKFFVGAGHIELLEVCVAVEEFLVVRDAIVLDPGIGIVEAVRETAHVSFPVADQEVKVVRTIAAGKIRRIRVALSAKGGRE